MKLRINASDTSGLLEEKEINVVSEETGEILQTFKVQQPIDYYINLVKTKYYINSTESDRYNNILNIYVFTNYNSKLKMQQTIINDCLNTAKLNLQDSDNEPTDMELEIPKSLDDSVIWQKIYEILEDNGISFTVNYKDTKFNPNYYYMYISYYDINFDEDENIFGGRIMKKYIRAAQSGGVFTDEQWSTIKRKFYEVLDRNIDDLIDWVEHDFENASYHTDFNTWLRDTEENYPDFFEGLLGEFFKE